MKMKAVMTLSLYLREWEGKNAGHRLIRVNRDRYRIHHGEEGIEPGFERC